MRRRKHVLGFFLLALVGTSVPAFAQQPSTTTYPQCTKTVSKDESDLAHQKYIAGKQDYDEGNYTSALRRFRDAYNLDCTKHELLIIISAAYEKNGDKKEALNALETYVARAPSAPDVGTYQNKIDNMKKQLATTPPPTASTTTPPNGGNPPGGEMREHTAWPWVVVGLGGAGVVAGIVIIATTPALPLGCNKTNKQCTPAAGETADAFQARQEEAGKSVDQPGVGLIFIVVGGAVALGGLAWHFLEPTGPKDAWQKKLRPAVAPGYAGLSLQSTF